MLGTLEKAPQLDIFRKPLKHILRQDDELVKLSHKIEWEGMVSLLSVHYSPDRGRKSIPVRKLAGLLILKEIYGYSDEGILRQYIDNLSFQYFCGEVYPQKDPPASRSELVKFRARIGKKGIRVIFYPELLKFVRKYKKRITPDPDLEIPSWNFTGFLRQLALGIWQ